jgi:hypothetical protein
MDDPIIPNFPDICIPRKKLRRGRGLPSCYDPARRLVVAVVLKAVEDAFFPSKAIDEETRQDAVQFLSSKDGRFMLSQILGRTI